MVGNIILEIAAALPATTAVGVVIHDSSREICKVSKKAKTKVKVKSVSMPRLLKVLWGLLFTIGVILVSHGIRLVLIYLSLHASKNLSRRMR